MPETTMRKMPAIVATTSVASLMLATAFATPMTGSTGQDAYLDAPDALVRYVNDGFDFSTSSNSIMTYERIEQPLESAKFAAYEMFGEMRSSTLEEKTLYENMLARMSTPIDVDIFAL